MTTVEDPVHSKSKADIRSQLQSGSIRTTNHETSIPRQESSEEMNEHVNTERLLKSALVEDKAWLCLTRSHVIRRYCLIIYSSQWFDRIILCLIMLNCIFLALKDANLPSTHWRNRLNNDSEWPFTAIYTLEMLIRMTACGVFGKHGYFSDRWNWLDFGLVASAYLSMLPQIRNATAARSLRVLRPLRALKTTPGLRIVVQSMLAALPGLCHVIYFVAFTFLVFGIIGNQLWQGVLRGRCAYLDPGTNETIVLEDEFCALPCSEFRADGAECAPTYGRSCGTFYVETSLDQIQTVVNVSASCMMYKDPDYGYTGFDNFGQSALVIFVTITLEGWVSFLYALNDTFGLSWLNFLYFMLLIMFAAYFLLNLTLAVIWDEYAKADERERDKRTKRVLEVADTAWARERRQEINHTIDTTKNETDQLTAMRQNQTVSCRGKICANLCLFKKCCVRKRNHPTQKTNFQNHSLRDTDSATLKTNTSAYNGTPTEIELISTNSKTRKSSTTDNETVPYTFHDSTRAQFSRSRHIFGVSHVQSCARRIIETSLFYIIVYSSIFLNTVALAVEHYQMPKWLDQTQDVINWICTIVFLAELGLKLTGLSWREYLADKFNLFDAVVVIISSIDLIITIFGSSPFSWIGVLRALRVLRAFQLLNKWAPLRRLVNAIVRSLSGVAYASIVLALFLFIYVLLGIQLFGNGWNDDLENRPRPHFDNFWWAVVTVFQMISTEDWQAALFPYMDHFGTVTAALYFISLVVLGNYIILNLFLAILLSNFDTFEQDEDTTVKEEDDENIDDINRISKLTTSYLQEFSSSPLPRTFAQVSGHEKASVTSIRTISHEDTSLYHNQHVYGPTAADSNYCSTQQIDPKLLSTETSTGASSAKLKHIHTHSVSSETQNISSLQTATHPNIQSDRALLSSNNTSPDVLNEQNVSSTYDHDYSQEYPAVLSKYDSSYLTGNYDRRHSVSLSEVARRGSIVATEFTRNCATYQSTISEQFQPILHLRYRRRLGPKAETLLHSKDGNPLKVVVSGTGGVSVKRMTSRAKQSQYSLEQIYGTKGPWTRREYSLFLFAPDNFLRKLCTRIVTNKWFERFVLFLIVFSSVLLALDQPYISGCRNIPADQPDSCYDLHQFLWISDLFVASCFVLEVCMKIVARGMIMEPKSYLREPWDILDFCVTIVSVVSVGLSSSSSSVKSFRAIRSFRALRPLRAIRRFEGIRLVVNAVIGSIPRVGVVLVVNLVLMLLFAIIGVQSWMGKLYRCNDPSIETSDACTGTFNVTGSLCRYLPTSQQVYSCEQSIEGAPFPRLWEPLPQNFDNVLNGLLCVFQVATNELWPTMMYNTVDAVAPGVEPERDHNQFAAAWFILIQIIFSFYMFEIFTGVVVDYYHSLRDEFHGAALLSTTQATWVENIRIIMASRPIRGLHRPHGNFSRIRDQCFLLASSYYFDLCVTGLILLNAVALASRHYGMSDTTSYILDTANIIFVALFTLEAMIKLIGFGIFQYFHLAWNRFDFILVVIGLIGLGINAGGIVMLFRVFRAARLLRVIRGSHVLRQMFTTLLLSLPALINIMGVLFLVIYVYAVIGMNAFYGAPKGETGDYLNNHANFDGFWVSMLTLFRAVTGEDWNGIMYDLMVQEPYCMPNETCGSRWVPPIFFCSFVLITSYVLVNVLVAVVLQNFLNTSSNDGEFASEEFGISDQMLEHFNQEWALFDPKATYRINTEQLIALYANLQYPLGLRDSPELLPGQSLYHKSRIALLQMEIPQSKKGYMYHAVLHAIISHAQTEQIYRNEIEEEETNKSYHSFARKSQENESGHVQKPLLRLDSNEAKSGINSSARQVIALQVINDFAQQWRYRTKCKKLQRQLGHCPDEKELLEAGITPRMPLKTRSIQAFVLIATRDMYLRQRDGFRRPTTGAGFVFAPKAASRIRRQKRKFMGNLTCVPRSSNSGMLYCRSVDVAREDAPEMAEIRSIPRHEEKGGDVASKTAEARTIPAYKENDVGSETCNDASHSNMAATHVCSYGASTNMAAASSNECSYDASTNMATTSSNECYNDKISNTKSHKITASQTSDGKHNTRNEKDDNETIQPKTTSRDIESNNDTWMTHTFHDTKNSIRDANIPQTHHVVKNTNKIKNEETNITQTHDVSYNDMEANTTSITHTSNNSHDSMVDSQFCDTEILDHTNIETEPNATTISNQNPNRENLET